MRVLRKKRNETLSLKSAHGEQPLLFDVSFHKNVAFGNEQYTKTVSEGPIVCQMTPFHKILLPYFTKTT